MMIDISTPSFPIRSKMQILMLTLVAVLVLHLVLLWRVWNYLPPNTLAESPYVHAIRIHFVSSPLPNEQHQHVTSMQNAQTSSNRINPSDTQHDVEQTNPAIINTDSSQKKVQPTAQFGATSAARQSNTELQTGSPSQQNKQLQKNSQLQASSHHQPLSANSTALALDQPVIAPSNTQDTEERVSIPPKKEQPNTTQLPERQSQKVDQVKDTPLAATSNTSQAPVSKMVSSVDVIRFGRMDYHDHELLGKTRSVLLRLQIDHQGQPTHVLLEQSSGIDSLDQIVLQAAETAQFVPYKENGRAMGVTVNLPIELTFRRKR